MIKKIINNKAFCISALACTLLFIVSCEEIPKIKSKCVVKSFLTFVNSGSTNVIISFTDSTNWDQISNSLEMKDVNFPDTNINLPKLSIRQDSISLTWIFEHPDKFHDVYACTSAVDIEVYAVISDSSSDTLISQINLGLSCLKSCKDTSFTDSNNVHVELFLQVDTLFITN